MRETATYKKGKKMRDSFKAEINDMKLEVIYEVFEPRYKATRTDPSDPLEVTLLEVNYAGDNIISTLDAKTQNILEQLAVEHSYQTR